MNFFNNTLLLDLLGVIIEYYILFAAGGLLTLKVFYNIVKTGISIAENRKLHSINPEFVAHPKRNLTAKEQTILTILATKLPIELQVKKGRETKNYPAVYIIFTIAIVAVSLGFIILFLNSTTPSAESQIAVLAALFMIGSATRPFKKANYYLDKRSPVFEIKGKPVPLSSSGTSIFQMANIRIEIAKHPEYATKFNNLNNQTLLKIEYSPHSKHIWNIEKV